MRAQGRACQGVHVPRPLSAHRCAPVDDAGPTHHAVDRSEPQGATDGGRHASAHRRPCGLPIPPADRAAVGHAPASRRREAATTGRDCLVWHACTSCPTGVAAKPNTGCTSPSTTAGTRPCVADADERTRDSRSRSRSQGTQDSGRCRPWRRPSAFGRAQDRRRSRVGRPQSRCTDSGKPH